MSQPARNPLPRPPTVSIIPPFSRSAPFISHPPPVQSFVFTPAISLHVPISSIRSLDALMSPLQRYANNTLGFIGDDIDAIEQSIIEEKRVEEGKHVMEEEKGAEEKREKGKETEAEGKGREEEKDINENRRIEEKDVEEKQIEEERRLAEEKRVAEEKQLVEEKKEAKEREKTEQILKAEELRKMEEKHIVEKNITEEQTEKHIGETIKEDEETKGEETIIEERRNREEQPTSISKLTHQSKHIILTSDSSNTETTDTTNVTTDESDSSLFEVEELSPAPYHPPPSIKIDEDVLITAQTTGNFKGPSGLPLFNLDRVQGAPQHISSESESDPSVQPSLPNQHVDTSILISQLSQMDESSDPSEVEACREGEQEVKSAAVSSFLSLLQKNKEIVSDVRAKTEQATMDLEPVKYRRDKIKKQPSNPKAFLIDYICRHPVQSSYVFQNSKQISIHSTYSELIIEICFISSVNQYIEVMMFCVLEELLYSVTNDTHSLFEVYNPSFLQESVTSDESLKTKHSHNHVQAHVTAVGEKGGDFIHVVIDRPVSTPYKWNESIILLCTSDLSHASKTSWMAYGVCNCSVMNSEAGEIYDAKRAQWIINMRCDRSAHKAFKIGSTIHLYSVTPFTSFLR